MISIFPARFFPDEVFALVFSIIFVIVLLTEIRILFRRVKNSKDRGSLMFILIAVFVPIILTLALTYNDIGLVSKKFAYVGMVLIVGGFILRQYSILILGRFFVPVVSVQKGQTLVDKGPYKIIRHPSYTGLFLEVIGFSACLSNILGFLIGFLLFVLAVSYRIRIEENFLLKNLKGYKEYCKKTYRLIPFVY